MCGQMMGGITARASPYGAPRAIGYTSGRFPAQTVDLWKAAAPQNPQAIAQIMGIIDDKARRLLQQLPHENQIDLASFLLSKIRLGAVSNPSAWMIKSCTMAGATADSNPQMSGGSPA